MADPIIGNNVRIEIESSASGSLTISAITKDDPAVVTFTEESAGSPANGDIVVLQNIEGMDELNGQVARVVSRAGSGASEIQARIAASAAANRLRSLAPNGITFPSSRVALCAANFSQVKWVKVPPASVWRTMASIPLACSS